MSALINRRKRIRVSKTAIFCYILLITLVFSFYLEIFYQLNSGAPIDEDTSPNVTDSAPDNNPSEDNATPFKEEIDFELDSEQDDPTGKIDFYGHIK